MSVDRIRVGQFFLLLGLIALVIFFATRQSQTPMYALLCGGLALVSLGIYIFWRSWKAPEESGRFRSWRKWQDKRKQKKKKES